MKDDHCTPAWRQLAKRAPDRRLRNERGLGVSGGRRPTLRLVLRFEALPGGPNTPPVAAR
jgi:hypothetical protein